MAEEKTMMCPSHPPANSIAYENSHKASEALIPVMLKDLGIENSGERAASQAYASQLIQEVGDLTMGELSDIITNFAVGYNHCLKDHSLV